MAAVCLLLSQLPVSLLWHLLHWPHLHISDLGTQIRDQYRNRPAFNKDAFYSRARDRGIYLDMRRGTEDKCDCTGYVFCFQTLEGGEKRCYWCSHTSILWLFCEIYLLTLTFILSYTAAAFSGSLLWCLKANSVSTIPGDIHCREDNFIRNALLHVYTDARVELLMWDQTLLLLTSFTWTLIFHHYSKSDTGHVNSIFCLDIPN